MDDSPIPCYEATTAVTDEEHLPDAGLLGGTPTSSEDLGTLKEGESHLRTLVNLIKGNVGPGCLSLPYAFSQVGHILGVPCIILMASFTLAGWRMLLSCKRKIANDHPISYGEVTASAFGASGRFTVNSAVVFTQLGICCVYFAFIADCIKSILPSAVSVSLKHLILLQLPVMLLMGNIQRIKSITPLSVLANLCIGIGICIVVGYDIYQLTSHQDNSSNRSNLVRGDINGKDSDKSHFSWSGLALFFGNAIFSFEGIGIILPIENESADPSHFRRLMDIAMVIIIVVVRKNDERYTFFLLLKVPSTNPIHIHLHTHPTFAKTNPPKHPLKFTLVGELTLVAFGSVSEGSATAEIALHYRYLTTSTGYCDERSDIPKSEK